MIADDPNIPHDQLCVTAETKEIEIIEEAENPESCERPQLYYEPRDIGDIEDVEDYRPGGLHPVDMFDTLLDDRFEVCHKLGSGGIATVWLCYEKAIKKWKAIKINAADRSSEDSPEIRVSKVLQKGGDASRLLEEYNVAMPLETFWIDGPNGRHLCTVLPVLGPRLSEWREMSLCTDAARINDVCYQLTKGLSFLHSHGICHGDFRPENILMQLKGNGLDDLEPEQLFDLLHYPDKDEVFTLEDEHSPHAPKWVVDPLWWSELKKYVSDDIAIVDFGEAFEESQPPESLGIPKVYAAPEVIYGGMPLGTRSDLWSLAYTIMGTRTGLPLQPMVCGPLIRMERFAGPIPAPYRHAAAEQLHREDIKRFQQFVGEDDSIENAEPSSNLLQSDSRNLKKLTWETTDATCLQALEDELSKELHEDSPAPDTGNEGEDEDEEWEVVHYRLSKDEVVLLADLLSKLFKYQPSQRISASDALQHSWFKNRGEFLPVHIHKSDSETPITTLEPEPAVTASQSETEIEAPESVPAKTRQPWGLAGLWELASKLLLTSTSQLMSSLVLFSFVILFLAVTSHLLFTSSLCQKIEVIKMMVLRT
ncbi:kinase-like domain-containing protein [Xylaria curta]|nr:kinase-like domain-containing protein [Xylaria curta]